MIATIKVIANHADVERAEFIGVDIPEVYSEATIWFDIDQVDSAYEYTPDDEIHVRIDGEQFVLVDTPELREALDKRFA